MRRRAWGRALVAVLAVVPLTACLLLPRGRPVAVDNRAGSFWTGNGVLLERSDDGKHCRVAVRGSSLLVEKKWVPCRYVHDRRLQP